MKGLDGMATTMRQPHAQTSPRMRLAIAPVRDVKVRDASETPDGSWTIEGYAAVFDQETTLVEVPGWFRIREIIDPGAFTRAEAQPVSALARVRSGASVVHLNHGHDMKTVMAATDVRGIGGLELGVDFHGLAFRARVDPQDPDAKALAVKMGRGIVKQASFCFTIADETIDDERVDDNGTEDVRYRILEVGELYDVCVAAQGAYPQTESHLRALAAASTRVVDLSSVVRARRPQPAAQERADVPSLECLCDAWDALTAFQANEDQPDDGPDRDQAQQAKTIIEALMVGEASEPDDTESEPMMAARARADEILASSGRPARTGGGRPGLTGPSLVDGRDGGAGEADIRAARRRRTMRLRELA